MNDFCQVLLAFGVIIVFCFMFAAAAVLADYINKRSSSKTSKEKKCQ
jgi:hypothetical protein